MRYIVAQYTITPNGDGTFTVQFLNLPITTEGDSLEDAHTHAADALTAFGEALLSKGLLTQVLEQHGVEIYDGSLPAEWVPKPVRMDLGSLFTARPHALPVYA